MGTLSSSVLVTEYLWKSQCSVAQWEWSSKLQWHPSLPLSSWDSSPWGGPFTQRMPLTDAANRVSQKWWVVTSEFKHKTKHFSSCLALSQLSEHPSCFGEGHHGTELRPPAPAKLTAASRKALSPRPPVPNAWSTETLTDNKGLVFQEAKLWVRW